MFLQINAPIIIAIIIIIIIIKSCHHLISRIIAHSLLLL